MKTTIGSGEAVNLVNLGSIPSTTSGPSRAQSITECNSVPQNTPHTHTHERKQTLRF